MILGAMLGKSVTMSSYLTCVTLPGSLMEDRVRTMCYFCFEHELFSSTIWNLHLVPMSHYVSVGMVQTRESHEFGRVVQSLWNQCG